VLAACGSATILKSADAPPTDAPIADAPRPDGRSSVDAAPDASHPDAAPDAPPTCAQIAQEAVAIIGRLDKTCDTVADCIVIGGTFDCDCAPSFTGYPFASGLALSKNGAADATLVALAAEFDHRCRPSTCTVAEDGCICDAGPPILTCTAHTCLAQQTSCLFLPDAPPSPG
jgi:hypothetical protein